MTVTVTAEDDGAEVSVDVASASWTAALTRSFSSAGDRVIIAGGPLEPAETGGVPAAGVSPAVDIVVR